jgi:antitoxin component of MazEF toxin-antitoxin module
MTQKIIRIGSSAGITIPKKELKELGLAVGDEVKYTIEPVKEAKHDELMQDYQKFVKQYGDTLKNLADR